MAIQNPAGRFGGSGAGEAGHASDGEMSDGRGSLGVPASGRLGGSGSGQPNSLSPSMSQKQGQKARNRPGSGRPHNLAGFDKAKAQGTLINDINMKRMGPSFGLRNPMRRAGAESHSNRPSQLPSQHIQKHGNDDHAIANQRLDNAITAANTEEKRSHVFGALTALNKVRRKRGVRGKSLRSTPPGGQRLTNS